MAWLDWFDVPFIRHVIRHVSGTMVTIVLFAATAWFVKRFIPLGLSRDRIEGIEHVVFIGLFIILAIQLFISVIKEVWKQLRGGWNVTQVFAI